MQIQGEMVRGMTDVEIRAKKIVNYLKEHGYAEVLLLSELLNVSDMTVRRDLDRLQEQGILLRVRGGATLVPQKMDESTLDIRLQKEMDEKCRLGEYAASLVEDGDAIAIDSSSTTYAMVPYLNKEITVITNHILTASALLKYKKVRVIMLGGHLRRSSMSAAGKDLYNMMQQYYVDKVFLSTKAVDMEHGAADASIDEGESKKVFMNAGKQCFFLFDHTKLNTSAFYHVCSVAEIKNIILDPSKELNIGQKKMIECFEQAYVNIHYCDSDVQAQKKW